MNKILSTFIWRFLWENQCLLCETTESKFWHFQNKSTWQTSRQFKSWIRNITIS